MSDLLIKGMEMPKKGSWVTLRVFPDGQCFLYSWCGNDFDFMEHLTAVPVPPHGRLIDEREISSRFDNGIKTISKLPLPNDFVDLYKQLATEVKEEIGKCRTVIPASEEASA